MEIALSWLVLCFIVSALASSRGRSAVGFFFLSFFLSPLIGLLVLLVVRNLAAEHRERTAKSSLEQQAMTGMRPATGLSQLGVADELRKLAELRSSGVLSEEEFLQLKVRLLADSDEAMSITASRGVTCARCGSLASLDAVHCPGCGGKFVRSA